MNQDRSDLSPKPSLYGDEPAPVAVGPAPGLADQFVGVFTEPGALFSRLRTTPVWVGATVLSTIVAFLATLAWLKGVDLDAMLRPMLEGNASIPADKIDDMIGLQSKITMFSSIIGALVGTFVSVLLGGLIHWLMSKGNRATGIFLSVAAVIAGGGAAVSHLLARMRGASGSNLVGLLVVAGLFLGTGLVAMIGPWQVREEESSYTQSLSLSAVSGLVVIPYSLLMGVFCLLRKVGGLTPDKLAPTSLGFFVHAESPKLQALLFTLDPFILGSLVILGIGARRLMRFTPFGTSLVVGFSTLLVLLRVVMAS